MKALIERFGVFHEVHEDFYEPDTFAARQPMSDALDLSAHEAGLLRQAADLLDRNVERSPVVSRTDNNWLSEVVYEIRQIVQRVEEGYRGQAPAGPTH